MELKNKKEIFSLQIEEIILVLRNARIRYHYRATDIQCALGISQLKKINKFLSKRRELAKNMMLHLER